MLISSYSVDYGMYGLRAVALKNESSPNGEAIAYRQKVTLESPKGIEFSKNVDFNPKSGKTLLSDP